MMMYEDEGITIPKVLLFVAVILVLVGSVWWGISSLSRHSLEVRVASDLALADQTLQRVREARSVWKDKHLSYADHWSIGIDDSLTQAEEFFSQTSGVKQAIVAANQALEAGDLKSAKNNLESAEANISTAGSVADQILGSTDGSTLGLYDRLADWSAKADGQISAAQLCVTTTQPQLIAFQNSVNYASGIADLANTQILIDLAYTADSVPVERGIIDKPQAYSLGTEALAMCNKALIDAAPPPPTPEPQAHDNQPIVIFDDDDNDSGGSSYDWSSAGGSGSDSGSFDYSGWDSGSDSSWDSGWDSGSDSSSWDSDWDSGGDSGSWSDPDW